MIEGWTNCLSRNIHSLDFKCSKINSFPVFNEDKQEVNLSDFLLFESADHL